MGTPYALGIHFGPKYITAARALEVTTARVLGPQDGQYETVNESPFPALAETYTSAPVSEDDGPESETSESGEVSIEEWSDDEMDEKHVRSDSETDAEQDESETEMGSEPDEVDDSVVAVAQVPGSTTYRWVRLAGAYEDDLPSVSTLTHIQKEFAESLLAITRAAGRALYRDRVDIMAASIPSFWPVHVAHMLVTTAHNLGIHIDEDLILKHEETARLAYNLGRKINNGSWYLILVDYNVCDLFLTFAEIDDHEGNKIKGKYRYNAKGKHALKDAPSGIDHTHIRKSLTAFIRRNAISATDAGPARVRVDQKYLLESNIRAVVLTGDASKRRMESMRDLLKTYFRDLPQRRVGPVLTQLDPKEVGAIGAARAVRAFVENDDPIDDVVPSLRLD